MPGINSMHINNQFNQVTPDLIMPEWQQKLHELMQFYIEHTPPKQLGRSLRTYFLLHVSELKIICREDIVLHIITMLELMDDAKDSVSS